MTTKKFRNKEQNKGFTLVEVLVAISILAIIVVPLLQAFVTSARTNTKAKQIMRSTTLAENVLEQTKAYSVADIARQFNGNGFTADNSMVQNAEGFFEAVKDASGNYVRVVTPDDAATGTNVNSSIRDASNTTVNPEGVFVGQPDNNYYFLLNGVAMNPMKYDVAIAMEVSENSGLQNMTEINAMNRGDCAYYAQSNSDLDAAKEFEYKNQGYAQSIAKLNEDSFRQMMNRRIIIDINDDGSGNQSVKITYEYTIGSGYTEPEDQTITEFITVFDNYDSGEQLKAVYLYYYPLYGSTRTDTIDIVNKSNLDVDVYLIRTQGTDYDEALELTYVPYINVSEKSSTDGQSHTTVCTNNETSIRTYSTTMGVAGTLEVKDLGNVQEKASLYDVTVRIYKYNETNPFGEDDLITTITGSKLDNSTKRKN